MVEFWQDPYILSVLVFVALLAVYVYRDRKKFDRQSIVLLRRTQRGKNFIVDLAEKHTTFWRHLGTAGVFIGFGASIVVFVTLIQNLVKAATVKGGAGLALLLPSPTSTAIIGPGVFAVPFWYWIIAIALLVVVHEGLHGVMSAVGKIKIKSLGWGLLAVIPLAFVEPDEKALQKKNFWVQQRVFAAGSLANFILAFVALIVLSFVFAGIYGEQGVGFQGYIKGYPAESANLTGVIVGINNNVIKDANDLNKTLTEIGPEKEIIVKTKVVKENSIQEKTYNLKTVPEPNSTSTKGTTLIGDQRPPAKGFIGIGGVGDAKIIKESLLPYSGIILFLQGLFFFLFMINLGVGMANLLPVKPLDGGRMWETLLQRVTKKHSKKIVNSLGWLTFLLIIANFVVPQII